MMLRPTLRRMPWSKVDNRATSFRFGHIVRRITCTPCCSIQDSRTGKMPRAGKSCIRTLTSRFHSGHRRRVINIGRSVGRVGALAAAAPPIFLHTVHILLNLEIGTTSSHFFISFPGTSPPLPRVRSIPEPWSSRRPPCPQSDPFAAALPIPSPNLCGGILSSSNLSSRV